MEIRNIHFHCILVLLSYQMCSSDIKFFFTPLTPNCRVYLAIVEEQDHRGLVVQQGGGKALLPLAIEGTEKGKAKAAQALAKIAITMNPEVAFPGQRVGR